jgi:hypothetical protein
MHISNEDNVTVSATYGQGSESKLSKKLNIIWWCDVLGIDCSFQQQTLSDKDPAVHN